MIVLEEFDTEFGNIRIVRSKSNGACTYYQNTCSHSEIDMEGVSTCSYIHIMCNIISQSEAKNVLLLGCAGGTLATMLHRLGHNVTIVDINPHSFVMAKKYFHLPDGVNCVVADGFSYLLKNETRFDAIAIDVFNSDGSVPEEFVTKVFFHTIREALVHRGVVVMNVIVGHDLDMLADSIGLNMESAAISTVILDWENCNDRNVVIAGGNMENISFRQETQAEWLKNELKNISIRTPVKHKNHKTA